MVIEALVSRSSYMSRDLVLRQQVWLLHVATAPAYFWVSPEC